MYVRIICVSVNVCICTRVFAPIYRIFVVIGFIISNYRTPYALGLQM